MAKKGNTKKALLMSALSLLLCVSMLVSTTFAWFTDEVTSGKNQIIAGNLDVELEYSKDMSTWNSVAGRTDIVDPKALWEPGHTEVVYLRISNIGTLALKYNFSISFVDTVVGKSVEGNDIYLSQHLKYAVVDVDAKFADRDAAREAVENVAVPLAGYAVNGEMEKDAAAKTVALVIYMPEETGNEANYRGEKIPQIEMGINLVATQKMEEEDSFGPDYDANADVLAWDGSADTEWYDASKSEFVLYTAEELAGLSSLVYGGNNFSGKTVKLSADINLANKAWTPIGRMANTSGIGENSTFKGNFDGQGYTVYNLNVDTVDGIAGNDNNKGAGLFGSVTGNISNVNIENATIVTAHWAGAVVGYIEGSITKCSVKNVKITCLPELIGAEWDNGDKAGAIVGYASQGSITDCTVTDAEITAYRQIGAIAGGSYNPVSGCIVSNVTLIKDSTHDYKGTDDDSTINAYVGSVYGGAAVDATGDVTIIYATTFTVSNDDELVAALASTDTYIIIELAGDVALSYPARSAYAGAATKSVKINGNGYKLTLKQTDGDWSSIGLANADGVLTLNDLNVVKAAHAGNGAWNNHAINFTCKVEMNGVTFDNSVALEADATLKNITITDAKGDYYGLIVTAEGQTVTADGLNITAGRAIKVMDQYVDAPEKVTIEVSNAKFTTNKKAAILVTSTAGADIIIGEKVDISGCTADSIHEVWVDEERAASMSLVTVNGGSKILEGKTIASKDDLTTAIANAGVGEIIVLEGNVEIGAGQLALDKAITIDLNENTLSADYGYGIISLKNGASIKNGTIDVDSNVAAIRAFNVGSIENVTINIDPKATEKVATAIAVQNGGYVGTIKNVTITNATQGIELGKGAKVDLIENVVVKTTNNGSKQGIALQINAGYVGKIVNSTFEGETYGVHMMLNGEFTVALELVDCVVTGGTAALYAHDEAGIANTNNCSLTLTYDADTVFNGDFVWDFEEECQSVLTLNKPN